MQPETIRRTVSLFEEQPEKAKSSPTVKAHADGSQAAMEAGPFSWRSDLPEPMGGYQPGSQPHRAAVERPGRLRGGLHPRHPCPQLGVRVDAVEATARCEADARGLLGMAGAEPDLKNVRLDIRVQSPDSEGEVQRVYEAWRERCPIYLALTEAMDVSLNMETTQG